MPIERFNGTINSEKIDALVEQSCRSKGNVLRVNSGEDEQTLETYSIYTVGETEDAGSAVVFIGNDTNLTSELSDWQTRKRPHVLIAPQEIIDEVVANVAKLSS